MIATSLLILTRSFCFASFSQFKGSDTSDALKSHHMRSSSLLSQRRAAAQEKTSARQINEISFYESAFALIASDLTLAELGVP